MHTLVLIYLSQRKGERLTSVDIAKSAHTNPSYIRQLMMALRSAGLVETARGSAYPRLARPIDKITLCDVYCSVEKGKPLLHLDTHINPECGVGVNIQLALQEYYDQVQRAAQKAMGSITLGDVVRSYDVRVAGVSEDASLAELSCMAEDTGRDGVANEG